LEPIIAKPAHLASPDNDNGAVMMVVIAMVVTMMIRLRISGSREEGDEST
jgi:hypothetical protein